MNSTFFPCRKTAISKLGRYSAIYCYPVIGILLLIASLFLIIDVADHNYNTLYQLVLLLLAIISSIVLASFLFYMSRKCSIIEERHISISSLGFTIRDKSDRWYAWDSIGTIGIIAYAASASKQNYQTQICIFIEPVNDVVLRKLRDSYLYGAFNHDKLILLDFDQSVLSTLKMCNCTPVLDLRTKQRRL